MVFKYLILNSVGFNDFNSLLTFFLVLLSIDILNTGDSACKTCSATSQFTFHYIGNVRRPPGNVHLQRKLS